jgi:hypothetical protein
MKMTKKTLDSMEWAGTDGRDGAFFEIFQFQATELVEQITIKKKRAGVVAVK